MPINKFGALLGRGNGGDQYYQYNALVRSFVRDNALCATSTDYDARSRKIKHVAEPLDDTDAANKRYVQQNIRILKDQLEELDKKIEILQNNLLIVVDTLRNKAHS